MIAISNENWKNEYYPPAFGGGINSFHCILGIVIKDRKAASN